MFVIMNNMKQLFKKDIPNKKIFFYGVITLLIFYHGKHFLELLSIGIGTAKGINSDNLLSFIASALGTIFAVMILSSILWGLGWLFVKKDRENPKEAFWHYYIIAVIIAVLGAIVT